MNFVDPMTGVHTQNIESYWTRMKTKFKRMKGIHAEVLTFCMDDFMWQVRNETTVMTDLC